LLGCAVGMRLLVDADVGRLVGTSIGGVVAVGTALWAGVGSAVRTGVGVGSSTGVTLGVADGVAVGSRVGVAVSLAATVGVGVAVSLAATVGVGLAVTVAVAVAVPVAVAVTVGVGLAVANVTSAVALNPPLVARMLAPPRPGSVALTTLRTRPCASETPLPGSSATPAGPENVTSAPLSGLPDWSSTVASTLRPWVLKISCVTVRLGIATLNSGVGSLRPPPSSYARTIA
jgi:hypothetical protein